MPGGSATRRGLAIPAALVAVLLVASQALAVTWSTPVALSSSSTWGGDYLATLGGTSAVVQYEVCAPSPCNLYTRRTTNSGVTWQPAVPMATSVGSGGLVHEIAGLGLDVDSVWLDRDTGQLRYAHSADGGASFGSSILLSSAAADSVSVARGPNGLVAVAYESNAGISVRVSNNGGTSFANAKTVASGGAGFLPQVAIGNTDIYVAWVTEATQSSPFKLHMRRSVNGGASWKTASTVATNVDDNAFSVTASGTHAYIAYTTTAGISYRRTLNSGGNWSAAQSLSPSNQAGAWLPVITLQNSVLRALYTLPSGAVYYRQSSNGTSWGHPSIVQTSGESEGVGYSGKTIVLYFHGFPYVRTS